MIKRTISQDGIFRQSICYETLATQYTDNGVKEADTRKIERGNKIRRHLQSRRDIWATV